MEWNEILIGILNIALMQYVYIKCYEMINSKKIENKKALIVCLTISSVLSFANFVFNPGISRMIISFLLIFISNKIIFDENMIISFIKSLLVFVIASIAEIIVSIIILLLNFTDISQINRILWLKTLLSIINIVLTYCFFKIDFIKNNIKKILNGLNKNRINSFGISLLLIFIIITILIFEFIKNINFITYITQIIIILVFIVFSIIIIYEYIKSKKAQEKEEILLNFMSKYEKIIDDDRINRHEMLNNLLIIKSFKNKNTRKFEEMLNEIILLYTNKGKIFNNLYNLPTGLKGLIYYKIYDMKADEIEVMLNISTKTYTILESLDEKLFFKICKILGILLDNAREAAKNSIEKKVVIDIYKEKKNLIIFIENSSKFKTDVEKIKEKNYSTHGKKRGLGLFVANQILNCEKRLNLVQKSTKKTFTSILKIK